MYRLQVRTARTPLDFYPAPQFSEGTDTRPDSLDAFVFNDDEGGFLDTRLRLPAARDLYVGATGGPKIIILTRGIPIDDWAAYESLSAFRAGGMLLENDSPSHPACIGSVRVDRSDRSYALSLAPLMARISLGRLTCNFSGTSYEGAELENIRIYLTNAGGQCRLLPEEEGGLTLLLNQGGWNEEDCRILNGEGLSDKVSGRIGKSGRTLNLSFYTYENTSPTEEAGAAWTRLVVEGDIRGRHCYYPINVNRADFGIKGAAGICRGCHYAYNVTLRRLGTDDPDCPVQPGTVLFIPVLEDWQQEGETLERF